MIPEMLVQGGRRRAPRRGRDLPGDRQPDTAKWRNWPTSNWIRTHSRLMIEH